MQRIFIDPQKHADHAAYLQSEINAAIERANMVALPGRLVGRVKVTAYDMGDDQGWALDIEGLPDLCELSISADLPEIAALLRHWLDELDPPNRKDAA